MSRLPNVDTDKSGGSFASKDSAMMAASREQCEFGKGVQRAEKKYLRLGLRYHLLPAEASSDRDLDQAQNNSRMAFTATSYYPPIVSNLVDLRKGVEISDCDGQFIFGPTWTNRLASVNRQLQSLQKEVRRFEATANQTKFGQSWLAEYDGDLDSPLKDSLKALGHGVLPIGVGRWFREDVVFSEWIKSLPLVQDWLDQVLARDDDQAFVKVLMYADVGEPDDEDLGESE
ncbi:unnamed protein product [Zymoseptoria tritici ST99CH_3D1]|nr:unnamed protein product [Zymoseptoria tritici ST99CH_3D1]